MKGILQWKSKHDSTKLYMIDTCTCKLSWLCYQAIYCTSQITLQCQAFEHKLINVLLLHQVSDRIQEKTCKFIVTSYYSWVTLYKKANTYKNCTFGYCLLQQYNICKLYHKKHIKKHTVKLIFEPILRGGQINKLCLHVQYMYM